MAARIIEIADAVVTDLNSGEFSMDFEATRAYVPTLDLKDADELKVTVFPKQYDVQWASRSTAQSDYQIDVGVQKKFDDESELDGLMGLVQEIIDFLWERARPAALPEARITNVEHGTIYAAEHVTQLRQFTSVFTVTYRLVE